MRRIPILTAIMMLGFPGAVLAQGGNEAQCARLQQIIKTPPPTIGASASLEHTAVVLKAAIGMIDLPCGAPYIVSTDKMAITQERARLYEAWKQARSQCLQLTAGVTNYDPLSDASYCGGNVSPD